MSFRPDIRLCHYPPVRIVQGPRAAEDLLGIAGRQQTIWSGKAVSVSPGERLLLDFGEERNGGVRIVQSRIVQSFREERPIRARLRFGESLSEAIGNPDNQHAIHDTLLDLTTMGENYFGNTGFRFACLDNCDETLPLRLLEFSAYTHEYVNLLPRQVNFEDDLLNKIFANCERTIRNCLAPLLLDGAKRDRLIWMGDLFAEIRAVWAVYGNHPAIPETLDFLLSEGSSRDFNNMPNYLPYWFLSHQEYYRLCRNEDYYQAQMRPFPEMAKRLLAQFSENSEQLFSQTMIDWSEHSTDSAYAPLYCCGLRAAAAMARAYKQRSLEDRLQKNFQKVASRICLSGLSKAAATQTALAGIFSAEEVCRRVLFHDREHELSTFHCDRMLDVWSRAGYTREASALLKRYYGGMIQLGATTFWEHFELNWLIRAGRIDQFPSSGLRDIHKNCGSGCFTGYRHSLCHGWSAAVAAWLLEHVKSQPD